MTTVAAFVAASRFGLGARPGELAAAARDPRGWLLEQLRDDRLPSSLDGFPPSSEPLAALARAREEGGQERARELRRELRGRYREEAAARARAQIESRVPFRERLVAFWSNHFTVSIRRPQVVGAAAGFEREAIRPHVTGSFRDMLGAVVAHPAMLLYLDNAPSIGPNSVAGQRRERGLNENLARELLELHTLGVDGGYSQDDVRELARMLTGWSVARPDMPEAGGFRFEPRFHEPGDKILLGVHYAETGREEVERALDALAVHPATARHVARKLARHFIADDPPPGAVDALARAFIDTGGDLGAVARTLVGLDAAWESPLAKVKDANDVIVSTLRGLGSTPEDKALIAAFRLLGQMPHDAPSPAGWPDTAAGWIGPEALMRRTEFAVAVAGRTRDLRPDDVMAATVGPVAGSGLRRAVARAPSASEGLATLLASPTFQRR